MLKKNKLLLKFVIVYSILLISLVICSGIIFEAFMFHYSQKEIGTASLGKLEIISGISELLNESIEKDAITLASDKSLNELSNVHYLFEGENSAEQIYRVSRAIDALRNMKLNNYRIESIYLYLENCDYILSTDMNVHKVDEMMQNQWFSGLMMNPENHWSSGKKTVGQEKYVFSFVFNLRFISDLRGWLVINVDENIVCNLINRDQYIQEGYIFVVNRSGQVMSHIDKNMLGKNVKDRKFFKRITEAKRDSGYFLQNSGKRNLVVYSETPLHGWIYIGMLPLDTLTKNMNSVMLSVSLVLTILLGIGALGIYIISKRQLHPLILLMNDIRKRGIVVSEKEDSIKFIYRAFETLEHQVQSRSLSDQNDRKNLYLRSLLLDDIPVRKEMGLLNETQKHMCVAISLDHYSMLSLSRSPEERDSLKKLVLEVFNSALSEVYVSVGCLLHYDMMALVLEEKAETNIYDIKGILEIAREQLQNTTDYSVSCGVGDWHEGLPGVRISYQEALEALQYRLLYGFGHTIFWKQENSRSDEFNYQEDRITMMLNQISSLQKEKANSELEKIFDKMISGNAKFDNIWLSLNQLFSSFLEFLVASNIGIQDILRDQTDLGSPFYGKETIDEIKEWFLEIIERIIEHIQTQRSGMPSQIEQIFNYIKENYNRDISIDMIAEHVNLSYSYVRKIFKDETGKNMIDYINDLRIEKAKELLGETGFTIAEIAEMIGYPNTQGFLRNFKKKSGITPTEYRNMYK